MLGVVFCAEGFTSLMHAEVRSRESHCLSLVSLRRRCGIHAFVPHQNMVLAYFLL